MDTLQFSSYLPTVSFLSADSRSADILSSHRCMFVRVFVDNRLRKITEAFESEANATRSLPSSANVYGDVLLGQYAYMSARLWRFFRCFLVQFNITIRPSLA